MILREGLSTKTKMLVLLLSMVAAAVAGPVPDPSIAIAPAPFSPPVVLYSAPLQFRAEPAAPVIAPADEPAEEAAQSAEEEEKEGPAPPVPLALAPIKPIYVKLEDEAAQPSWIPSLSFLPSFLQPANWQLPTLPNLPITLPNLPSLPITLPNLPSLPITLPSLPISWPWLTPSSGGSSKLIAPLRYYYVYADKK